MVIKRDAVAVILVGGQQAAGAADLSLVLTDV